MKFDPEIELILDRLEINSEDVFSLVGDASARRFFRLATPRYDDNQTAILIVFPKEAGKAEVERYLRMAEGLLLARLPVPKVYQVNSRERYIVVEDGGAELLQDLIRHRNPIPLYRQAIDLIVDMRARISPAIAGLNPPFDQATFLRELDFFLTYALEGYYGADLGATSRTAFRDFFLTICRESLIQPRVFCHRDYHSRNLLVPTGRLMMIDFQDGRLGPYTYDLVSLLEDPYAALESGLRDEMKRYYLSLRSRAQEDNYSGDFYRDYDMMSIQRLLKAAGTYGYMFMEKGKSWYAEHLPEVLQRVDDILEKYHKLWGLRELLKKFGR